MNCLYKTPSRVAIHSTKRLVSDVSVVLAVPGGPWISGHYLVPSVTLLAERLGRIGAVVDLPNHGSSERWSTPDQPFRYAEAKQMLVDAVSNLREKGMRILLIGHSFGAFLGADVWREKPDAFEEAVLVSWPIEMGTNPKLHQFLSENEAIAGLFRTEAEFQAWCRKVIPAYFLKPPPPGLRESLCSGTRFLGNESYSEGQPPFAEIAADLQAQNLDARLLYIEGEKEWILPENNFERVSESLPRAVTRKIKETGHFPMLDQSQNFAQEVESWCARGDSNA